MEHADISAAPSCPDGNDAESEFCRRLTAKLAARGVSQDTTPAQIDTLLRRGVGLRLDVDHILGRVG